MTKTLADLAREGRRWTGAYLYLGDYRLRLQSITWQWHGLEDRRWHVHFKKADAIGGCIHRSFTWAVICAIADTYRNYIRYRWNAR